jgi:hypothetical protein
MAQEVHTFQMALEVHTFQMALEVHTFQMALEVHTFQMALEVLTDPILGLVIISEKMSLIAFLKLCWFLFLDDVICLFLQWLGLFRQQNPSLYLYFACSDAESVLGSCLPCLWVCRSHLWDA